jgi:uncharacterized protein (TIGR01732 family)
MINYYKLMLRGLRGLGTNDGAGYGTGFILILVLFILLVIIGAGFGLGYDINRESPADFQNDSGTEEQCNKRILLKKINPWRQHCELY